ncbi:MAG TPA: 1,4-alpha-glucan branching enzyme, partial [Bacteroidetes bacterium]|nr:1,4-alpha-glucan branching enzyme [Bacteroidota bacterium]
MKSTLHLDEVWKIVNTDHYDPFSVLGAHVIEWEGTRGVVIRAFLPDAQSASVVELSGEKEGTSFEMKRILNEGFFELFLPDRRSIFPYKLARTMADGTSELFYDSYSFLPTLTDFDLYLFNAGDHHRIYEKLGAHHAVVNDVGGIQFAVWAPSARSVSVIGSFNGWDRRKHAMRVLGSSGVWEIFIPGLKEGELYKFQIKTKQGAILDKCDPYGFEMEMRPSTAARVNLVTGHTWGDERWMMERSQGNQLSKPISVYEVHLGSWSRVPEEGNRWLTYRELAERLVAYVKKRGFTHIELLPIMEHPFDGS